MKVIQAFSWTAFCLFAIAIWILFDRVATSQRFGRQLIWNEPIRGRCFGIIPVSSYLTSCIVAELPWYGEAPGFYNTGPMNTMAYPAPQYPVVQGQGQQLIIQPGVNGQPPTVLRV